MNDFGVFGNSRSAFLGLERRRKSEGAPKWRVFGEVFEYFGAFFAKSGMLFAKIERNQAVFDSFGKDPLVFARVCEAVHFAPKIRTYL